MITPVNNPNPSFKRVDVIHIPKKLFGSQTYTQVERSIEKTLIEQLPLKEKLLAKISNKFKLKAPCYEMFLESPGYAKLMDKLKEEGGYSLDWLSAHTGFDIRQPIKQDLYSLFIVTGKDLLMLRKALSKYHKVLPQHIKKSFDEYSKDTGRLPDKLWTQALVNNDLSALFKAVTSPIVLRKYINHPDDFKRYVKEIFTP